MKTSASLHSERFNFPLATNSNPEPGRLADGKPDITTSRGRAILFEERIEAFTKPIAQGGKGMGTNEALDAMRQDPECAELLKAMGDSAAFPINRTPALDLAIPERRQALFNARIDVLTLPKEQGGAGYTVDEAIDFMRGNDIDKPLLAAMGGELPANK